ncbi:YihY/virulence factor BrkB family protein [Leptolyngbya sp. FACHB-261]|uniref:YihY/virulence factor BrkB family protein n=1 Tax=Leptolyngbya sp. FACHB-261 TaxID=2692806 RepID=UPI0016826C34|nr:YihY/virulence factor BrkB family protein [Leptolyngbya sp. FACHB-261]MBD2102916.1 YihY/virulence factor BrkB family protein [Leptolyngbya sp. FACHB-261]
MNAKAAIDLIKETITEWNEDKASRLAAALAYYTVFSLAPLLIIAIAVAGFVFGEEAARGQLDDQIQHLVGAEGADAIQAMIQGASKPSSGRIATIIGIVTLLFGASGVFGQLQEALNTIWEVAPKPGRGIVGFIKDRFLSFSMVLGTGFLLLVSLVLSAILSGISAYLGGLLPGFDILWQVVNFAISFGVTSLLFALIYKVLPDANVAWGDVTIGAIATSLLFTIGRTLIGIYLGSSGVGSTYGAAGSLVIVLLWVYYSAQILFLGAEFTQVYARKYGSRIVPASNAIPVTEEARAQQGMPRTEAKKQEAKRQDSESYRNEMTLVAPRSAQQHNSYGRYLTAFLGSALALVSLFRRRPSRSRSRRRR